MTTDSIEVSGVVPTDVETVFEAWLDGPTHSAMTGAEASCEPGVGGRFTAWDGYIEGRTLQIEAPSRIVQAWRTSHFPEGSAESRLEVRFAREGGGTRVTFLHSDIPEGQGASYEQGWIDHYLDPMKAYFSAG